MFNGLLAFYIQCLLELIRVKPDQTDMLVTMFLIAHLLILFDFASSDCVCRSSRSILPAKLPRYKSLLTEYYCLEAGPQG